MAARFSNRNLAGACNCYGWLKHYHIDVRVYNHTVITGRGYKAGVSPATGVCSLSPWLRRRRVLTHIPAIRSLGTRPG